MSGLVVGLVALLIGFVACFFGRWAARVVMSLWGSFVGFAFGSATVAAISNSSPLSTLAGWVAGIIAAIVVGSLAYSFYALAVAVSVGSFGYGVAAALAVWFGADVFGVHIAGLVGGVLLAILTLALKLPDALLIVFTAAVGAGAMISGLLLILGQTPLVDISFASAGTIIGRQEWWWTALYLAITFAGILSQSQSRSRRNQHAVSSWSEPRPATING